MARALRICFDKLLPQQVNRPQATRRMTDGNVRALSPKGKQWVSGSKITIRFLATTSGITHAFAAMTHHVPGIIEYRYPPCNRTAAGLAYAT